MSIDVSITDQGSRHVKINEEGELLVSDGAFDTPVFNELAEINTAYNFFKPKAHKVLIITGFLAYGDKQISTSTNSTVVIYEGTQADTTTADRVLFQFEIGNNQSIPFPSIKLLCRSGYYINAKCDDDDVHMTILGHYVNAAS